MSFILDALRRADAERERGQVPGLNSQAQSLPPAAAAPTPVRRQAVPVLAWLLSGVGAGLVLAASVGWWLSSGRSAGTASVPSPLAATSPAVAPPSPPPVAATGTAATSPAPAPAPAPMVPAQPDATPALAPSSVVPARAAVREPRLAGSTAGPAAVPRASAQAPARSTRAPSESPADGPAGPRSAPLAAAPPRPAAMPPAPSEAQAPTPEGQLPRMSAADRQRLPKLQIGGAMYSEERSSRMLVVNDQLLREGDRAAPGVTLLRIGPRSARFVFEGQVVDLPY